MAIRRGGTAGRAQLQLIGTSTAEPRLVSPRRLVGDGSVLGLFRPADRRGDEVLVTLGVLDALAANAAGYRAAAVSPAHADRAAAPWLARLDGRLVIAFPPDSAGQAASRRLSTFLEARGRPVATLSVTTEDLGGWLVESSNRRRTLGAYVSRIARTATPCDRPRRRPLTWARRPSGTDEHSDSSEHAAQKGSEPDCAVVVPTPMLAAPSADVPVGRYAFEPKWDGMRALVEVDEHLTVRVWSRRARSWTAAFPELASLGRQVGRPALLDGELVVMGDDGRPQFQLLMRRLRARRPAIEAGRTPATFVAFDLLHLGDRALVGCPWSERRHALEHVGFDQGVAVTTMVSDDGQALYDATRGLGVEGIVAKRVDSRYLAGRRSRAWLKVKHRSGAWFDLVAWRLPGGRDPAGGLVIADDGHPAGVAIPALAATDRAALRQVVERHGHRHGTLVSVPPGVQVRVEYTERSAGGIVREAVARQVRPALPQ